MGPKFLKTTRCLLFVVLPLVGFEVGGCAFDNEDQAPQASATPPADTVQVVNNSSAQQPPPQGGVVYAPVAPPPNKTEYLPTQPAPDAFWIGGHYVWGSSGWTWVDGHYERPPYPGANYTRGYYAKNSYGYRWVGGYWK
jgi:hypothetical protein